MEKYLSPERLSGYRCTEFEALSVLLDRYFYNILLSQALYPSLAIFEVVLRNSIQTTMTSVFGETWMDSDAGFLQGYEKDEVERVKFKLKKAAKSYTRGRVIAELNLGFWVGLFTTPYRNILWPATIKGVFPHAKAKHLNIKHLHQRLKRINRLRNRIFHHEPIWKTEHLMEIYQDILQTIEWIEPRLAERLQEADRFLNIYQQRPLMFSAIEKNPDFQFLQDLERIAQKPPTGMASQEEMEKRFGVEVPKKPRPLKKYIQPG